MWRKTILATAIVGAGLASTTGAAFAGESAQADNTGDSSHQGGHDSWGKDHGGGDHDKGHGKDHHKAGKKDSGCDNDVAAKNGDRTKQHGLLNINDVQTIIPTNVCGNDVPINVLGLQVPVQHVAGNAPVASPSKDHSGSSAHTS